MSWSGGLIKQDKYREFIDYYGPAGMAIQFHDWGEPLLNPNLPEMVKIAKRHMLYTFLSSNLSVKFDAEQVVRSGIDYMELAIDGATSESYTTYRKGGDLDLVLQNIKRLAAAKRKYGIATPLLSWRFLTFKHNELEIDQAIELARELGVNRFHIATPFPNSGVGIEPVKSHREGAMPLDIKWAKIRKDQNNFISEIQENEALERSFTRRLYDEYKHTPDELLKKQYGRTCKWLYTNMFIDADGRILPCCAKPVPSLVYGDLDTKGTGTYNSDKYVSSREWFARGCPEPSSLGCEVTACMNCPSSDTDPNMNLNMAKRLFGTYDVFKSLSNESIESLTNW